MVGGLNDRAVSCATLKFKTWLSGKDTVVESQRQGFATRAIHVGQAPDPTTGATIPPMYLTSTYTQQGMGQHQGYEYGRGDNPTRGSLEAVMASLENGRYGLVYASGMAAVDAVIRTFQPGDEILAGEDLYGGVYRLFEKVYALNGLTVRYVDLSDLQRVEEAIGPRTRLLWVETPTNPLLHVTDIQQLAQMAHAKGVKVAVDNTFASPYLQNPLDQKADIVVHSMTKYLGGHSDVLGGAVVTNDPVLADKLAFLRNAAGAILGPFEAWLIQRGIKTLSIRMERHCANARAVARHLSRHRAVERVYYPGVFDGEARRIAAAQMRDDGGMVSFVLGASNQRSIQDVNHVLQKFHVFSLAESLGGVESLVGHPATMTHASIPQAQRLRRGISDGLVRLSVGIEDVSDLLDDLDRALAGW